MWKSLLLGAVFCLQNKCSSSFTVQSAKSIQKEVPKNMERKENRIKIKALEQNKENDSHRSRRDVFGHYWNRMIVASTLISSGAVYTNANANANAAVLQSGPCASGEGEACEQLANGNEFIRSLQMKSAQNREKNEKEALFAYNMKNYPDYFASMNPPRFLVMKKDGTFEAFTEAELSKLKSAGKIGVEVPKTKGGKVTDVTQKAVMVMKD